MLQTLIISGSDPPPSNSTGTKKNATYVIGARVLTSEDCIQEALQKHEKKTKKEAERQQRAEERQRKAQEMQQKKDERERQRVERGTKEKANWYVPCGCYATIFKLTS